MNDCLISYFCGPCAMFQIVAEVGHCTAALTPDDQHDDLHPYHLTITRTPLIHLPIPCVTQAEMQSAKRIGCFGTVDESKNSPQPSS